MSWQEHESTSLCWKSISLGIFVLMLLGLGYWGLDRGLQTSQYTTAKIVALLPSPQQQWYATVDIHGQLYDVVVGTDQLARMKPDLMVPVSYHLGGLSGAVWNISLKLP